MARGHRSPEDFASAAHMIVLESGWPGLTAAALAERLGVHPTAIYRHFATWNDLVVAAFDLSLARIFAEAMGSAPEGASPRDRIMAFMRTVRAEVEADPNIADCVLAILRRDTAAPVPNFDAASAQIAQLLTDMGVPEGELPALYQAIEAQAIGGVLVDYIGHPHHFSNRRQRRRLSGVAAFEPSTRSDEATKSIADAAFELSARLLLDECERLAAQ